MMFQASVETIRRIQAEATSKNVKHAYYIRSEGEWLPISTISAKIVITTAQRHSYLYPRRCEGWLRCSETFFGAMTMDGNGECVRWNRLDVEGSQCQRCHEGVDGSWEKVWRCCPRRRSYQNPIWIVHSWSIVTFLRCAQPDRRCYHRFSGSDHLPWRCQRGAIVASVIPLAMLFSLYHDAALRRDGQSDESGSGFRYRRGWIHCDGRNHGLYLWVKRLGTNAYSRRDGRRRCRMAHRRWFVLLRSLCWLFWSFSSQILYPDWHWRQIFPPIWPDLLYHRCFDSFTDVRSDDGIAVLEKRKDFR